MSKKDDIIAATKAIISEEGIMQATIGNILKKAGTGYGTLYNYFDSKEDLYLAVYIEIISGIEHYIRSQDTTCGDLEQSFRQIVRHYTIYCLNNITSFNTLEVMRHLPEMCERAKTMGANENGLYEVIEIGEQAGLIKKRAPFYNMNFLIGIVAVFVRFYSSNLDAVTEEVLDDFIDSSVNALR